MEIPLHRELGDLAAIDYAALLWPDRSRREILGLFTRGRIRSGGRAVRPRERVGDLSELALEGSLEDVERMPGTDPEARTEGSPVRILYEDGRFAVLEKPSGVPVVPARGGPAESCLAFLVRRELAERPRKSPSEFVRYRVVHRIDRLTSGLVIVAKTGEAERRLAFDFERRRVRKEYLALLEGEVLAARVVVNCPVVEGRKGKMRAAAAPGARPGRLGKGAMTRFDVLERLGNFTFVRAVPASGRTHQIRVHAWAAGHPVAGDPLYAGPGAGRPSPPGLARLALHAHRYALGEDWAEPRAFECPLAGDLEGALRALRGRPEG